MLHFKYKVYLYLFEIFKALRLLQIFVMIFNYILNDTRKISISDLIPGV